MLPLDKDRNERASIREFKFQDHRVYLVAAVMNAQPAIASQSLSRYSLRSDHLPVTGVENIDWGTDHIKKKKTKIKNGARHSRFFFHKHNHGRLRDSKNMVSAPSTFYLNCQIVIPDRYIENTKISHITTFPKRKNTQIAFVGVNQSNSFSIKISQNCNLQIIHTTDWGTDRWAYINLKNDSKPMALSKAKVGNISLQV